MVIHVTCERVDSGVWCKVAGMIDDIKLNISECKISTTNENTEWMITKWNTRSSFSRHGFGTTALASAIRYMDVHFPHPKRITYSWNGENEYVKTFLEKNFDATLLESIADIKHDPADSKKSHIFNLDVPKAMSFGDMFSCTHSIFDEKPITEKMIKTKDVMLEFAKMAYNRTLLTYATQEDLLMQIIGTILKVAESTK